MMQRLTFTGLVAAILLSSMLLTGCVAKRINLVDAQVVRVEKVDSDEAIIDQVNVHQHENEIEIEVLVRPRDVVRHFVSGQVQVEITDHEESEAPGSEQNEDTMSFIVGHGQKSQYHPGSKLQHTHFWVRFPYVADQGTLIRVTHLPAKSGKGSLKID